MKFHQGFPLVAKKTVIVEFIIYTILLSTSFYLIHVMIKEYLAENTYFSVSKEPITIEDLPTITICIATRKNKNDEKGQPRPVEYGQDFVIQIMESWLPWNNLNVSMKNLTVGSTKFEFMEQRRQIILEKMRVLQISYVH